MAADDLQRQRQRQGSGAPGFVFSPWYDAAGDVFNQGNQEYFYDAEGRVCEFRIGGYAYGYLYDAAGNRVAKGSVTTWGSCDVTTNGFQQMEGYVVDAGGQQLTEIDGNYHWVHTNVYAIGKQIGTFDDQGLHLYFDDPLGTRRVQAGGDAGTLEAVYQSLPYGDGLVSSGNDDPTENHFTGKERDTESGNDYMFARYYNSATGRFLSPDWSAKAEPVPYAKLDNPQSLNLYTYAGNNPLNRTDPSGHCTYLANGSGKVCGSDGKNDGTYKIIKSKSEQKKIESAEKHGTHVSQDQLQSGVLVPDKPARQAMQAAVNRSNAPAGNDTRGGFHEEGYDEGHNSSGASVVQPGAPGPYHLPGTPGPTTYDPSTASAGLYDITVEAHVHPSGAGFVQPPSDLGNGLGDIPNAPPSPTISIEGGAGNNTLYIYDQKGVQATMPLDEFENLP